LKKIFQILEIISNSVLNPNNPSRVQILSAVLCFNWAPLHEGVLGEWRCGFTHSWPRHHMEVSGQLHALAALPPWKEPPVLIG